MTARVPAGPISAGADDRGRIWFGRCLALCGGALLVAAVGLALYAAAGGQAVPGGQPYRWIGTGPVHVTARSGVVTCAYSGDGAPRTTTFRGYDLVLASVIRGRQLTGHAGGRASILLCDQPVTVTAGRVVRAYPIAGSWLRFAAYLLAMLIGTFVGRPTHSRSSVPPAGGARTSRRRPEQPGPIVERAAGERTGFALPALNPARPPSDSGRSRPAWAATNLKSARIRAAAEPMRFQRTNFFGHQAVFQAAGMIASIAACGVLPLLVAVTGTVPPDYVTYPLLVAVALGSYVLVRGKLYDYRLGRPWQPRPLRDLPAQQIAKPPGGGDINDGLPQPPRPSDHNGKRPSPNGEDNGGKPPPGDR